MNDILITVFLYLLMVGIPMFLVWKIKWPVPLNLIILNALFIWVYPEFRMIPLIVYFVVVILIVALIALEYEQRNETEEQRIKRVREFNRWKSEKKQKREAKKPQLVKKCPNCASLNIEYLKNNRKSFSVGKATGGAILTGGVGTLAGFVGKKGKTSKWHCKECGKVFDLAD